MSQQKPPLKVVVAWSTSGADAQALGTELHSQLASSVSDVMRPGLGLEVRTLPMTEQMDFAALRQEMERTFAEFERVAVIALLDATFKTMPTALAFVRGLLDGCAGSHEMHRFFPISLEDAAFGLDAAIGNINFIRLQELEASLRDEHLMGRVCHELCRMLTDFPRFDEKSDAPQRVPPVKLFISHTKKDNGLKIAKDIARWYATEPPFSTFFDASEIPAGESFPDVIDENVKESTILVLQSDQYSTRYWCLEEVLRAKEYDRPLLGIYCVDQGEQRSFPYLGNIPTLSWKEGLGLDTMMALITRSVARETLKFLHFRKLATYKLGRTEQEIKDLGVVISARPPEMAVLARIMASAPQRIYLYPDPPISANEEKFLMGAFPTFQLSTLSRFTLPEPVAAGPATVLPADYNISNITAGDGSDDAPTTRNFDMPKEEAGKKITKKKSPPKKRAAPPIGSPQPAAERARAAGEMQKQLIGLSISAAEDMAAMGRMGHDVDHALNHFLRAFLAEGSAIIYGGDFRAGGFAERLQDLVRTYAPGSMEADAQPLQSYLPWPWVNAPDPELLAELKQFVGFHQVGLPEDLKDLPPADKGSAEEHYRMARALSHSRSIVNGKTTARIFMGGRLSGYGGFLPGVLEEFLLAVSTGTPIYLTGAFGGVSSQLIQMLLGNTPQGLLDALQKMQEANAAMLQLRKDSAQARPELHPLADVSADALGARLQQLSALPFEQVLRNGLSRADNERLFKSLHPAEMVALVMKGM